MDWLINNWFIVVAALCVGAVMVLAVQRFVKLPTSEQKNTIQAWLLQAVLLAEQEYGAGTGKLKLSSVYAAFCVALPWLAKLISFDKFSEMVDDALVEMRKLLEGNKAIAQIVEPNK